MTLAGVIGESQDDEFLQWLTVRNVHFCTAFQKEILDNEQKSMDNFYEAESIITRKELLNYQRTAFFSQKNETFHFSLSIETLPVA